MLFYLVIAIPTILLPVRYLSVLFTCETYCYAATKVHYSLAALQHQPFLIIAYDG